VAEDSVEVLDGATTVVLIADVFSSSMTSFLNTESNNSDQPLESTQQTAEKISRALQQVLNFEVSNLNINFDVVGYEQNISPGLREGITIIRDQIDQLVEETSSTSSLTTYAPSIVGASLTTGLVTWVLRSGLLLSATLTSSPLWRPLDPIPILMQSGDEDDSLFDSDEAGDGADALNDSGNQGAQHG